MSNTINELNQLIDKIGVDNLTPTAIELLIKNVTSKPQEDNTEPKVKEKKHRSAGNATRALEPEEYKTIMELLHSGFEYINDKGTTSYFNPQPNVALALSLEATLGLRISDVVKLKVKDFQHNRLELREKKTNNLQYREIDEKISAFIKDYALEHGLSINDYLINVKTRFIQDRLKIVSTHLGLLNIGTHSFRKYFATLMYNKSQGDIDLVRALLNHSSVTVTQSYFKTNQKKINEYSRSINLLIKED